MAVKDTKGQKVRSAAQVTEQLRDQVGDTELKFISVRTIF